MAVHDDTQESQQQQQQQRQVRSQGWSFHDQGLYTTPINRGLGSEAYNQMKEHLGEIFKQSNDSVEIALIDLDNSEERALAFSGIVVAMRNKRTPGQGVAYHVLVLEATGEKLSPVYENIGNQQVEIHRATADALDNVMIDIAREKVKRTFGTGPWHFCEGCVVPADFNVTDRALVHKLALNTAMALWSELQRHDKSFEDLNLAHITNDSQLAVTVNFSRNQITDAVNNPIRSDINVTLSSKKNNQNGARNSINNGDKEVRISDVSAYTELVWDPVQQQNSFNPYPMANPMQTQRYAARLILTNLSTSINYTSGSVLLALATSLSLRDENNWIQSFRSNIVDRNTVDMTDIGAINYEANLENDPSGFGKRIDTKGDNFKLHDLGQLIGALVKPGLIVSLDCPENAPQTHYTSVFAAAAAGSQVAYEEIFGAANRLTNGSFGKRFAMGTMMFVDTNNRIHNGYWTDKTGQRRDIRDIDHLAVCNLVGERSPEVIRRYSDTFLRTQIPLAIRLDQRKKLIQSLTNETAVFTGFSQRVTFSAAFMEALAVGIREAGLQVRVTTPLSGSDFNDQRGVASFSQQALLTPGQSFMNAGGMNNFGNYQAPAWSGNRW